MRKDDQASEQDFINSIYARLEDMRKSAQAIETSYSEVGRGGTHQAKYEKDAAISVARQRLGSLNINSQPLCFGRLDLEDDNAIEEKTTVYVGRISISNEEQESLVIDWRAPVAEPFYRATPIDPHGVVRRRHFHMSDKKIIRMDDEVFDENKAEKNKLHVVGEAALLSAVSKKRTGRMGDIVATIQEEQDRAIRAQLNKVLIVTGGPGTGKTAVALHRAAYLLYTYRNTLVNSGVLLVGPSKTFLRYIDEVLPSLGENDVFLRTINTIRTTQQIHEYDTRKNATLKGDIRMVSVLKNALSDRQHPLDKPKDITIDGYKLNLNKRNTQKIINHLKERPGTHNQKRPMFIRSIVNELISQYKKQMVRAYQNSSTKKIENSAVQSNLRSLGNKVIDPDIVKKILDKQHIPEVWLEKMDDRIRHNDEVKISIERMWPALSGSELYHDMCSFKALISSASKNILTENEQNALYKDRAEDIESVQWTDYDIALIDEADSICGPLTSSRNTRKRTNYDSEEENASRVIGELGLKGYMTASELAQRYGEKSNSEITSSDTIKTFGHVLIDEAQDFSPMQWRMIARRVPSMSMTIVGDFAQASHPGTCKNWDEVLNILNGVAKTNDETVLLSVNYRTPAEVMDFAHDIMREVSPELAQTQAVREVGYYPIVEIGDININSVVKYVKSNFNDEGTIAVIANLEIHKELEEILKEFDASAENSKSIDTKVAILQAVDAKGLEFDHVIIYDPHEIVGDVKRPAGWKSLFVTLTRATQSLVVIMDEKYDDRLAKIIRSHQK
ncbi:MAG: AAA family ATPase [Acidimicrobiia bacterium]|nr:AAA family ATPase [Acidimicrobiia bacterium]